jgi:hypothetical protein
MSTSTVRLHRVLRAPRSELYSQAFAAMLEKHRDDLVTARLNEIYGDEKVESSLDGDLASLQRRSLRREKR